MKLRTLMVAFAATILLALSACTPTAVKPLTPQQIAAVACPQLNLAHNQLVVLNAALSADPATAAIGAKAAASLATIHPIVTAVCNGAAASPTVSLASVQALIQTGLPALAQIAGSIPMAPVQQAQIQAALVVVETAAGVVGVLQQQLAPAAPAPAAAAFPAPAVPMGAAKQ